MTSPGSSCWKRGSSPGNKPKTHSKASGLNRGPFSMPGKRAVWFSRYKQKGKSRAPESRGREGAAKRPDWGGASGSQSSARPGILREAACGDRRFLRPRHGCERTKDKKVLSPIGRKGRFVAEKCNSLGGNGKVLGKFSVLHNQQKETQEFIRQFDRDFRAKKDRPGGVLRRFCFRIKAGQRAGSLVGETHRSPPNRAQALAPVRPGIGLDRASFAKRNS